MAERDGVKSRVGGVNGVWVVLGCSRLTRITLWGGGLSQRWCAAHTHRVQIREGAWYMDLSALALRCEQTFKFGGSSEVGWCGGGNGGSLWCVMVWCWIEVLVVRDTRRTSCTESMKFGLGGSGGFTELKTSGVSIYSQRNASGLAARSISQLRGGERVRGWVR